MSRRTWYIVAAAAGAVLIAAIATWWFVLRSDAPPPVDLDDAAASVSPSSTNASSAAGDRDLDGMWTIEDGSFAGYRVQEELATIGFTEAAGRTGDVDASLSIADGTVTAVEVTVNMQTLASDDDRRDRALRSQALETSDFPTASFTLTEPIALPASADSADFTATAVGDLTLHGVTRSVELALEARFVDGVIVVIGDTEILFSDYDIEQPRSMALLSVDDRGLMEFQLLFGRG